LYDSLLNSLIRFIDELYFSTMFCQRNCRSRIVKMCLTWIICYQSWQDICMCVFEISRFILITWNFIFSESGTLSFVDKSSFSYKSAVEFLHRKGSKDGFYATLDSDAAESGDVGEVAKVFLITKNKWPHWRITDSHFTSARIQKFSTKRISRVLQQTQ
jgi:hypothetical protein